MINIIQNPLLVTTTKEPSIALKELEAAAQAFEAEELKAAQSSTQPFPASNIAAFKERILLCSQYLK